ncbi:DUF3379 family protein [Pseudoalteromonas luteoviolacea]|uniref:DUF3379 domain-containing protein n=1 Tax=Pseudoalteromonas luteoviolacea S4060-1 TaxID=1365257 RepID=A0A162C3A4_9GAMM|nr:DUF3379 family protein [Pseudoalteromonas luteoviolacea]KZN30353.1 hypothetical protein N480_05225 [Pseudoalteromonas luteoviolacea S2607]KZN61474.1 hypothetical protein N478_05225 [Pseudoalteromonas luteoviolacea S4060-1]
MDDLEFRRRLFADPNDEQLAQEAKGDPEKQRLVDEAQDFDTMLGDAFKVPVPSDLQAKLLAQVEEEPKPVTSSNVVNIAWYRRFSVPIASAASVMLAVLVYFSSAVHAPLHAGEHALEHVYYEESALRLNKEVTLQVVNEKLAMLGGKLEAMPGKVTYATFCNFKGQRSLHLIFQSEHGPMTVFIVPSDSNDYRDGKSHFNDERFAGSINKGKYADTILVANVGTPIEKYQGEVNNSLRWL